MGSAVLPLKHEPKISDDDCELLWLLVLYTGLQRLMVTYTLLALNLTLSSPKGHHKCKLYMGYGNLVLTKLT